MKKGYKYARWKHDREIPTWPEDTEYMISRALTFKKAQGDK